MEASVPARPGPAPLVALEFHVKSVVFTDDGPLFGHLRHPFVKLTLLNELRIALGTGRTSTNKDGKGNWDGKGGLVVLPADGGIVRGLMVQIQLYDDVSKGPGTLLAETMIWMRDMLDHARIASDSVADACFSPISTPREQVWDAYLPDTETSHSKIIATLTCSAVNPLQGTPRRAKEKAVAFHDRKPDAAPSIEGILQVRIIEGKGLPNHDMFGKQDPYVIAHIKLRQHPLNRTDNAGVPSAAWLMTQSTARSAAIDGGGTDPVWSEGSKGSELRMAFDTLRTGDRVFLCLSVFDEDVGKDDTIGFGCVDVTDVAHREAGMPGSRFEVQLYDHDGVCAASDGLFAMSQGQTQAIAAAASARDPVGEPSLWQRFQSWRRSRQPRGGGGTATEIKPCGTVLVAVKVIVDQYMMRNAATRLQAVYRGRQQRRKYLQAKAASVLARSALSAAIAKGGTNSVEAETAAAVMLQCAWRSHQARRKVIELRQARLFAEAGAKQRKEALELEFATRAAVKIQSIWRMKQARKRYLEQKAAAALYRAGLAAAMKQQDEEKKAQFAARALQAAWRGKQARKEVQERKTAIKLIQAGMRGRLARKEYNIAAARRAAIRIQANWRTKQARDEYLKAKSSAILIQAGFRGALARGGIAAQRAAALMFQAAWRQRVARRKYIQAKNSAVLIQATMRGKACRSDYARTRFKVVKMQSAIRAVIARMRFSRLRRSAVKLQAALRGKESRRVLQGALSIKVLRGVKLADREVFGKQDPYVTLTLQDDAGVVFGTGKTDTVDRGGKNPVWEEGKHKNLVTLPFNTAVGVPVKLQITAWDEDNMKSHDLIGDAVLNVTEYLSSGAPAGEVAIQLLDKKGKPKCGTLYITLRTVRGHDVMVAASSAAAGGAGGGAGVKTAPSKRKLSLFGK